MTIDTQELGPTRIDFQYTTIYDNGNLGLSYHNGVPSDTYGMTILTECHILTIKDGGWFRRSTGQALRSPADNFSKVFGRKLALQRALQQFSKKTRKGVWNEYVKNCRV